MSKAELFLKTLIDAGYESYFVGGCVRDKILGRNFNDQDITTIATPEEVQIALSNVAQSIDFVGANFGVLICDDVEIAMFRTEEYNQVGKPTVQSTRSAQEDAQRRDFTINALFETLDGKVIDFVGGHADIKNGIIRAVGNPKERFTEDPSRILRAAYFAASFSFKIAPETSQAMIEMGVSLNLIPDALKGKILMKVYKNQCVAKFLQILKEHDLIQYFILEIDHLHNVEWNEKLYYSSAWNHTIKLVQYLEDQKCSLPLIMAGVFSTSGMGQFHIEKIQDDGKATHFGYETESVFIANSVLSQFEVNKKDIEQCCFIIRFHQIHANAGGFGEADFRKKTKKMKMHSIKSRKELEENFELLMKFLNADLHCEINKVGFSFLKEKKKLKQLETGIKKYMSDHMLFRDELPINGHDLVEAGFKGQEIGTMLETVLTLNIQDRDKALEFINQIQK